MMISVPGPIATLFHKAFVQGTRSTVLTSLGWLIGITCASSIAAFYSQAPWWVGTMFSVCAAISILLYWFFYIYFAFTDKDSLRSEKYYIQKMAIERGFVGDDVTGYVRLPQSPMSLPSGSDQEQGGDQ